MKSEQLCRVIFEDIYKTPFYKQKPQWLINPNTNKRLELDGISLYYRVAFEYDGIQHHKYIPYFHKSYNTYKKQLFKDEIKNELCKKHNIFLIRIPYIYTYKHEKEMKQYILNQHIWSPLLKLEYHIKTN